MKINITLLFILLSSWLFSGSGSTYDWDETFDATFYESKINHDEEATLIFDKSQFFYYRASASPAISLNRYEHRLFWVEDESAIDKMNELYLPKSAYSFKARIINSEGKVVLFDQSKIESILTSEGSSSYQKLALPGIETKCWVEVFYKMNNFRANERKMTDDLWFTRLAQVKIHEPNVTQGFELDVQVYNGYEKVSEGNGSYVYEARDINAVKDEVYTHEYKDLPRCDFSVVALTWKRWSNIVYSNVNPVNYTLYGGPTRKVLKTIGARDCSDLEKTKKIEMYVKQNITLTKQDGADFETNIAKILKYKIANETGVVAVFMYLLRMAQIDFELYLAADKDYIDLDNSFPSATGLSNFIFYLPLQGLYLLPNSKYYYAGTIPNDMAGMNALNIVSPTKGASFYIKRLPEADRNFNVESTSSTIELDLESDECRIDLKKSYYGDRAIYIRGRLNYSDEIEKKEYVDFVLLSKMESTELKEYSIENDAIELNFMTKDSLHFIGKLVSDELATAVPNGYLLNISGAMGNQMSFYQEGERNRNLYINESKVYHHDFHFAIPEGYKLENIENYEFDKKYIPEGETEPVAAFESKVEVVDGVLNITVHEYYQEGLYPKEDVVVFQSVVNAAYEFYIAKVMLVKE